jgi:nicotinate-nucleotide--dimethylbenzimidazole phosphoribosyltransferase
MSHLSAGPIAATIEDTIVRIGALDTAAMALAQQRLDRLTKPPGSLGRLEELVVTLAGVTGRPDAPMTNRQVVVVAADHGVVAQGVSAYPGAVTAQMVANFLAGEAAVNVLARSAGAAVTVVDVGVEGDIPTVESGPGATLVSARLRRGTDDFTRGPAMSRDDAWRAIEIGIGLVEDLRLGPGLDVLAVGEMGIGNTTAASAVVAALTGRPAREVTGRGTGVDDEGMARKVAAIERGLAVNHVDPADPISVLASVGGLEIGALVGLLLGAAANRVPVVLDGFITGAAALIGGALQPALAPFLIAGHRSSEPGHQIALDALGIKPYLDLGLRLGEASGAVLLLGVIASACNVRDEMATFESAAVSGPTGPA